MFFKNIPLIIQAIWSTGFNLLSRILPSYFATLATASQISLIYSLYAFTQFLAIPCGWLSDKIGKTKTLFLTFLILPFLIISFLFSKSLFFYTLIFFLIGILSNFYYSAINALVVIFFERKREALFKLESSYHLGVVLGPIIGGFLTLKYGLKSAFLAWISLGLIGLFLSTFLLKKKIETPKRNQKISLFTVFSILKGKKFDFFLFLITGALLTGLFEGIVVLSFPLYASKIGFDISKVGTIIGSSFLISMFFLYFLGKKLEKIKINYSLIIIFSLIGFSIFFMIFFNNLILFSLLLAIFTLGRAGGLNLSRSLISEILVNDLKATGIAFCNTIYSLGLLCGPFLAGLLIDFINIKASFVFVFFVSVFSILFLLKFAKT
jgi:MFS family permease